MFSGGRGSRSGFASITGDSLVDDIAVIKTFVKGSSRFEITECDSLVEKEKSISPHDLSAGNYKFDCSSLSNGRFQIVLKVSNPTDGVIVHAEGDLVGQGKQKNFKKEFTIEPHQAPATFQLKFINKARFFWQKASYDFKLIKFEDQSQQAISRLGSTVKRQGKKIRIKVYYDDKVATHTMLTSISLDGLTNELKQYGDRLLKYIDDEGDVVRIQTPDDLNAYFEFIETLASKDARERGRLPKLFLDSKQNPLSNQAILSLLHYGPTTPTTTPMPLSPSSIFPSFSDVLAGETIPSPTYSAIKYRSREKTVVTQWQLGKEIGIGANGRVFLGMDEDTSQLIAVKQIPLKSSKKETLKKLEEEIAIMAKLDHENIVRYLGSEKRDGNLYIFIDYIPGGNIETIISEFTLPDKVVRKYTQQILQGLSYLHRNNVVHCDIKGANILVHESGTVYLADFGCSKEVSNIAGNEISGTPNYMAPEVIETMKYTREGDIWSLGCTLLEMLTCQAPWYEQISHFENEFAVLNFIRTTSMTPPVPPNVSYEAADFLAQCFEKDPQRRPSADALLEHPFITAPDLTYPRAATPIVDRTPVSPPVVKEEVIEEEDDSYEDDGFTFDHIDVNAELSDDEDDESAKPEPPKPTHTEPASPVVTRSRRLGNRESDTESESEDDDDIENLDLDSVVMEVKTNDLIKVFEGEAQEALDKPRKRNHNRRASQSSHSIHRNSGSFLRLREQLLNELVDLPNQNRSDESAIQSFLRRNAKQQITTYGINQILKRNNTQAFIQPTLTNSS